jgi:hypothetical protein
MQLIVSIFLGGIQLIAIRLGCWKAIRLRGSKGFLSFRLPGLRASSLLEVVSKPHLASDSCVADLFKMLTYSRVCCAFSSACAFLSNAIWHFETTSTMSYSGADYKLPGSLFLRNNSAYCNNGSASQGGRAHCPGYLSVQRWAAWLKCCSAVRGCSGT